MSRGDAMPWTRETDPAHGETLAGLAWAVAAAAGLTSAAAVLTGASRPALAPWVALGAMGAVAFAVFAVTRRAREVTRTASLLGELARLEPESGLPGPRALWGELAQALEATRRTRQPLSVVMISLGELRNLHHERGIAAGQRLVRQAAQALQSTVAAHHGTAYRVHGQALAALLPGLTEAEAELVARRLEAALALLGRKNGELVRLVAGAAEAGGGDLPEDLLLRAERRCTHARAQAETGILRRPAPVRAPRAR